MAGRPWDNDELIILRRNAGVLGAKEIAALLPPDRTARAVRHKAGQMRLSLMRYGESHWSAKISDNIVEWIRHSHDRRMSPRQIAQCFHLNEATVEHICYYQSRLNDAVDIA